MHSVRMCDCDLYCDVQLSDWCVISPDAPFHHTPSYTRFSSTVCFPCQTRSAECVKLRQQVEDLKVQSESAEEAKGWLDRRLREVEVRTLEHLQNFLYTLDK